MSGQVDVLAVMDAEIVILKDRLSVYRRKADLIAAKKGERQITADRLRDWQEHRVERAVTARADLAELIERERMAREALEGFRADGVSGGKNFEGWHSSYDKAIEKARAYFARVGGAK